MSIFTNYFSKTSKSRSELVKEIQKEKPKETAKKKLTKTEKKKTPFESFDFKTLKGKDRETQINEFAEFHNLDTVGLNKLVDDILFTEKKPFRDEVAKAMLDNPSVLKEQAKIDFVTNQIITLAKIVGEKQEV